MYFIVITNSSENFQVWLTISKLGEPSGKILIYMKCCCCQSLQDHHAMLLLRNEGKKKTPIGLLMRAQIVSISEKSKTTSFTLMRYLESPDCDHFGED